MSVSTLAVSGRGLHSGELCSVRLGRSAGPVRFATRHGVFPLASCRLLRSDQGVQLGVGPHARIDLVEHLLAALGGLGIFEGLVLEVSGPELPLLDGGARTWCLALRALGLTSSAPPLEVVRSFSLAMGQSQYSFWPAPAPSLEVEIDFTAPGIGQQAAQWDGSASAFEATIAPARTFGFAADAARLKSAGRAAHVDPRAVIVLDERGYPLWEGTHVTPGELARHKLLDLIGDLYLYGGPPRGGLRVRLPGHSATHGAVREALRLGGLLGRAPLPAHSADLGQQ
jgi:UDP-3-O-[3-hydroxymyristoyl] N-acetylglucosamine deacetylase